MPPTLPLGRALPLLRSHVGRPDLRPRSDPSPADRPEDPPAVPDAAADGA
ncbi:hypothetical protein GCM10009663_64940 [Kitasatospora arboriphila]|uniref:Uncharacterized protein n=1 Tax=Kitasatospora arboriphila TaxID=258052 RepID=A0ABN1U4H4_9ACTN